MTENQTLLSARPPRDMRIDIIRGWLQLTIFASHAAGSWIGAWLIHGAWGLSDSSEQFVFLSGLMLGSVFARKAGRQGWRIASFDMLVRTVRLWRTQIVVFVLFGAMILLAARSGLLPREAERLGWVFLTEHPFQGALGAASMLYRPDYMDILPVFVWCMLLLPVFAALESAIGVWALALPGGLYVAAMLGLAPPSIGPDTATHGFNPLAWQILFLVGVWLGRRMLLLGAALPPSRGLFVAACVVLVGGLLLRLGWFGFLPWAAVVPETDAIIGKDALALPRLVHALALALVVARLVPRSATWMSATVCRWMAAAGRNSLQVFCLGLFLSWGVTVAFRLWPTWAMWLDAPLMVVGCAILIAFGLWLDRSAERRPSTVASGVPVGGSV